MNSIRLLRFLTLWLLFVTLPVLAEDAEKDPRLEQKVTLAIGSVTLEQFASQLTKRTGIQVTVGSSKSDWQVKDRRTIVYVKDVSAGDLMKRLALLHHYRLSKSGPEGKWVYNYRQDKRFRDEESKLRDEETRNLYRKAAQSLEYLASLDGVQLSQSELDQLADKQPYVYFLLKDPLGRVMCEVASKLPADILSRDKWSMSLDQADEGLRDAATRYMHEMKKLEAAWYKARGQYPADAEPFDYPKMTACEIRFEGFESIEETKGDRQAGVLGEFEIFNDAAQSVDFPFLEPDSPIAQMIYKDAAATRAGEDTTAITKEVEDAAKSTADDYPLKDDSILKEKIKLEKESCYPLILKHVHEKTGLSIVADDYRERWKLHGEQTVKEVVEQARNASDKETKRHGKWLVAEDRMWFIKRLSDIPEAYL